MNKPATKKDIHFATFILMAMVSKAWWLALIYIIIAIFINFTEKPTT